MWSDEVHLLEENHDDMSLGAEAAVESDKGELGSESWAPGHGACKAVARSKRAPPGQGKRGRRVAAVDPDKKKVLKHSGKGIRAKDANPKFHKRCRACNLYFLKELMPEKSLCYEDARGYDGLSRLPAKQPELDWWEETKNNDKLCVAALKAYTQACPD